MAVGVLLALVAGSTGRSSATTSSTTDPDLDLILVNGDIVTVDAEFTRSEAIAVDNGMIVAVGTDDAVLGLRGDATAVVDLGGRAVLPGFVDPHTHSVQNQTPDVLAMAEEQRRLIEGGTTTVGTPAIIPFNMVGYDEMVARDLLLQRTHFYLQYNSNCDDLDPDRYWTSMPFDRAADQLVAVAGVKIFADGGSCGAPAVSFDYLPTTPDFLRDAGWVDNGDLFTPASEIAEVVATTEELGGMIVIHAIGDVAIRAALDGIEQGLDGRPNVNGHRIDHNSFSSLLDPVELARYGELGITPAVQLMPWSRACAPGTLATWQLTIPVEPYAVVEHLESLRAANPGMLISWHGDGPFIPGTPLQHMYTPITRGAVDADSGEVCAPEGWTNTAPVSVEETIRMTTINAATAMQLDDAIGSIEVGKYADIIVLDADPFGPDPVVAIAENRPVATLIGGSLMFCLDEALDCASFGMSPPRIMTDPAGAVADDADRPEATPTASEPQDDPPVPVTDGGVVVSVRASRELTPAAAALDGDRDAGWMSGDFAPQWIELDLGAPTDVVGLRMRVDQDPAGFTRHRVLGGPEPNPGIELAEVDGDTSWGDWLVVELHSTVRYLRIETIESPSWVSWLEIEVVTAG